MPAREQEGSTISDHNGCDCEDSPDIITDLSQDAQSAESTNFQSIDRHSLSSTSSSKFKPQLVDPYVYHHEDSLPSPTREIQNKPFLDFSRPTTVTSSENESFCSVYGIDSFRMVHKHRMRHSCCSYLSEDFLPDMDSRSELSSTASSYFASHSPSSTLSISYSRVSKPIKRQKICHV